MVHQEKIKQVQQLVEALNKEKNFILVSFEKTTHQTLESIRKKLKKHNAVVKIIKNTLFEKAVNKLSGSSTIFGDVRKKFFPLRLISVFITLSNDWSAGLRSFFEQTAKEKAFSFKFGILDGALYPKDEIEKIAQLPAKSELIAQLVGTLKSPSARFVYSLKGNLNKFVYILREKR